MSYTCQKLPDAFIQPEQQHRRGVKHVRLNSHIKYILQMGHYLLKEPASKPQASVFQRANITRRRSKCPCKVIGDWHIPKRSLASAIGTRKLWSNSCPTDRNDWWPRPKITAAIESMWRLWRRKIQMPSFSTFNVKSKTCRISKWDLLIISECNR